jgi:thymidylate synthase (FAD)
MNIHSTELFSYTQPAKNDMTADEMIAYVARISNPANQNNHATAAKLLRYCYDNQHFSVFEMADVTLEIYTTRDIGRQIIRHRSFCFQEFSQRYADPTQVLGFELREPRLQDHRNRQNSIELDPDQHDAAYISEMWNDLQREVIATSTKAYKWAIDHGIAREQARVLLPEGNTVTRMYMKGSLRSWIHYCALRGGNGTQKEHMLVARSAWSSVVSAFPTMGLFMPLEEA